MMSWKMFFLTSGILSDVGFNILAIKWVKPYNVASSLSVVWVYVNDVLYPLSVNAVSYNGFAFSYSSSLQDKSGNLLFIILGISLTIVGGWSDFELI